MTVDGKRAAKREKFSLLFEKNLLGRGIGREPGNTGDGGPTSLTEHHGKHRVTKEADLKCELHTGKVLQSTTKEYVYLSAVQSCRSEARKRYHLDNFLGKNSQRLHTYPFR